MVQYYTLEEAARILRTTPDKLREMANKKQVRAFQDRGTLRFRAQEIDELARAQGLGSDAEFPLGEAPPKSGRTPSKLGKEGPPSSGRSKSPSKLGKPADDPVLLDFDLGGDGGDQVSLGAERPADKGSSRSGRRGQDGPKSSGPRSAGPRAPAPRSGGDSDVRLVLDGDLDFQIEDSPARVAPSGGPKSPSRRSKVAPPSAADSGVRLVPQDKPSDSDVKIVPSPPPEGSNVGLGGDTAKGPSDGDIRLEDLPGDKGRQELVTEEIDLDAEALEAAEAARSAKPKRPKPASTLHPNPTPPVLPTSSPFGLSEDDLSLDDSADHGEGKPVNPAKAKADTDSSDDFELIPFDASKSPLELGGDEEVNLGELTGAGGGSGINLQDAVDSGISLEEGGSDEIEFELSLDAAATPKPAAGGEEKVGEDPSSEFELSLDADEGGEAAADLEDSSSEFELSLDAEEPPSDASASEFELSLDAEGEAGLEKVEDNSDSEFELTLDAEGDLAAVGEEGEQDIFAETDFNVPALGDEDEESGSQAVALDESDTDLEESSDFELSLDEEGAGTEEDSDSQVVALDDEEEADAGAATVAKARCTKAKAAPAEEEDEGELDLDLDAAEAEEGAEDEVDIDAESGEMPTPAAAPQAAAPPAEWGVMPALLMFPAVIVLFVVGLMVFELIQGAWGYHRPGKIGKPVIDTIARSFDDSLPKD
jgi:excisionase family DNA binding protein